MHIIIVLSLHLLAILCCLISLKGLASAPAHLLEQLGDVRDAQREPHDVALRGRPPQLHEALVDLQGAQRAAHVLDIDIEAIEMAVGRAKKGPRGGVHDVEEPQWKMINMI